MKRIPGSLAFLAGLLATLVVGWTALPDALYRQQQQPLQFSHRTHTGDDVEMACIDCHRIDARSRLTRIPTVAVCIDCHEEAMGDTPAEQILVENYIGKGREIPWLVYSRQPDHVHFSHPLHVTVAELACEDCHGDHGASEVLPPYEENRLTGYSRLIWGHAIARTGRQSWEGKKMVDCSACHRKHGVVESCMDCHK